MYERVSANKHAVHAHSQHNYLCFFFHFYLGAFQLIQLMFHGAQHEILRLWHGRVTKHESYVCVTSQVIRQRRLQLKQKLSVDCQALSNAETWNYAAKCTVLIQTTRNHTFITSLVKLIEDGKDVSKCKRCKKKDTD